MPFGPMIDHVQNRRGSEISEGVMFVNPQPFCLRPVNLGNEEKAYNGSNQRKKDDAINGVGVFRGEKGKSRLIALRLLLPMA